MLRLAVKNARRMSSIPNKLAEQRMREYEARKIVRAGIPPNPVVSHEYILDKNREKAHQGKIGLVQKMKIFWKQYGIIGLCTYSVIKSSVFVGAYLMFDYNLIQPETLYIPQLSHMLHVPDVLDWISTKTGHEIPSGHKTDALIGAIAVTKIGWYAYFPFSLWVTPKVAKKLGYTTKDKLELK